MVGETPGGIGRRARSLSIQHSLNGTNLPTDVPSPPRPSHQVSVSAIQWPSNWSPAIQFLLSFSQFSIQHQNVLAQTFPPRLSVPRSRFFGLYCTVLGPGCQKQCSAHLTWYFNHCSMSGYIITSFLKDSMRRLTFYLLVISRLLPTQHSKALPLSNP